MLFAAPSEFRSAARGKRRPETPRADAIRSGTCASPGVTPKKRRGAQTIGLGWPRKCQSRPATEGIAEDAEAGAVGKRGRSRILLELRGGANATAICHLLCGRQRLSSLRGAHER